jgi:hypothetical protein
MYDLSWQAYNAIIAKEMCSKYWSGEEEEQRSSRGEDKHATTCEPRQSRLLTSIHVPHAVVSVERDGNCFYSSCSYLLRRLHVCDISPCTTSPSRVRTICCTCLEQTKLTLATYGKRQSWPTGRAFEGTCGAWCGPFRGVRKPHPKKENGLLFWMRFA